MQCSKEPSTTNIMACLNLFGGSKESGLFPLLRFLLNLKTLFMVDHKGNPQLKNNKMVNLATDAGKSHWENVKNLPTFVHKSESSGG